MGQSHNHKVALMNKENVYHLSKTHGPPVVDLQHGMIGDDWGDRSNAKLPTPHQIPEDVTRDQLDHYGSAVFSYMEDSDLLFYLYPIAKVYAEDPSFEWIDGYMYTLDKRIEAIFGTLGPHDRDALVDGLMWIWESGGIDNADWYQCRHLQKVIGIDVERDEQGMS